MNAVVAPWAQSVTADQELALKDAFADAWLHYPSDPFRAAMQVTNGNSHLALMITNTWLLDGYVINKQRDLIKERGEDHYLPNRAILIKRVMDIGEDKTQSARDRLAAFKLVAELRNFMPKETAQTNIQINQHNRVMVVKDHGTDDEWREKIKAQQARLVASANE